MMIGSKGKVIKCNPKCKDYKCILKHCCIFINKQCRYYKKASCRKGGANHT